MPDDDDNLPIIDINELPKDQVIDTLATSLCLYSSGGSEDDEDDENMIEDYPLDDLNLDEDEPREELEPDDEDEDDGDYEYDIGED